MPDDDHADRVRELEERIEACDAEGDADGAAEACQDLAYLVYDVDGPGPSVRWFHDFLARTDTLDDGWEESRVFATWNLCVSLRAAGRGEEGVQVAAALHRRYLATLTSETAAPIAAAAVTHAFALREAGKPREAVEILEHVGVRLEDEAGEGGLPGPATDIACALSAALADLGEIEEAFELTAMAASWCSPPYEDEQVARLAVIAVQDAETHGAAQRPWVAIELLESVLERFAERLDPSTLTDVRNSLGYHRSVEVTRLAHKMGRGRDAERLARQAIAEGSFQTWMELAAVLAVTSRDLDQEEHAWRQALAGGRAAAAAINLATMLAYDRGDRDAARPILAEEADGRAEDGRLALAVLEQIDAPGFALRRLRHRVRRARMRWWRTSALTRLLASR